MPPARPPRLAAGRARAVGLPTRGTTNPNRLRRMDRWITAVLGPSLPPGALVIDLGYGASPVTTLELATRLRPDLRLLGLEIDPVRVAAAEPFADPPRLEFARGGFELAGRQAALVRAANVLRQYDEAAARAAWAELGRRADFVVEGTCDEIGRLGAWVLLEQGRPVSLTLAARTQSLSRPSDLAERLPKALIHHHVPGQPIHALLRDFDVAWDRAATPFGARQRWIGACSALAGWPIRHRSRFGLGELTVDWDSVSPVDISGR